jgi:Cu+-exporting ATPase
MNKTSRAARGAAAVSTRATQRFAAEGLDCPSCGAEVRDGLRQLTGIFAVSVNVQAQEIAVTFDPARVAPDQIQGRLSEIGFGCK